MESTFDGAFDSAESWDGCVGWFSSGDVVESINAVDDAFDDFDTETHHFFESPGSLPGQFGHSISSGTYSFVPPPTNVLLPSGGAAIIPYMPSTPYTQQRLETLVTRDPTDFTPSFSGALPQSVERSGSTSSIHQGNPASSFINNYLSNGKEGRARSLSDLSGDAPSLQARTTSRSDPPLTDYQQGEIPRRQAPRFPGDQYAASWIRSEGTEREGWCGLCSSWHKLKDSAYWYHMHYSHGISCQTGKPFDNPVKGRAAKRSLGYEVLCGGCNKWLQVSRPERWRTPYYRHAYRCHAKKGDRSPTRPHSTSPRRTPSKSSKK